MLGQPTVDAHAPGRRASAHRRATAGRHRDRRGPHHHRTAAQARRGRQVRRVLRPRRGLAATRDPRHHRQHVPRVRRHLRDVPDRPGDPRLPGLHGPCRGAHSTWWRPTPRPRASGTTPTARARRTPSTSNSTWRPSSRASPGPSRPQDRVSLSGARGAFRDALGRDAQEASRHGQTAEDLTRRRRRRGRRHHLVHQHLEPSVHRGGGTRRQARRRLGPHQKPWVKTSLAPGSRVVMDYLERAGLVEPLDAARLLPRGLRLHDVHRQLRTPARGRLEAVQRARPVGRRRCSRATATSRVASTPTSAELPRVAPAGRRLRARRARWTST